MTIRSLVDRERRHVTRAEIVAGALGALSASAVLLALASALLGRARWLVLPRALPLMVWPGVAAILAAVYMTTRRRLVRHADSHGVAHAIEHEQGMRRGLLIGALELEGKGALADRAAARVRNDLPVGSALAPALRKASTRRAWVGAAGAAAGVMILVSASPLFGDGLAAVLRPLDAWRGRLLPRPEIVGAPHELLRGSPLRVSIRADGRRAVYLDIRQTGDAWRTDTLVVDKQGQAEWSTDALRGDVRLVATDGRASSDSVTVHAADRPFVGAVNLHVHYPAYLGRADESLPVGEPIHVPRASVITISGRASVPLTDVTLIGGGGDRVSLTAGGQTFSGRFTPEKSEVMQWSAKGPGGLVPDLPEPLNVDVVPDSAPLVTIAEPTSDTVLVAASAVGLVIRATDDHGLAAVTLHVARANSRDAAPIVTTLAVSAGTSWSGAAVISIDSLRLSPGDAVKVRAEAVDGSPWAQRGTSREIVLRRATTEEQRAAARAMGDSAVKEALSAAKAEQSLAQRTDEAARTQARQGAKDATAPAAGQQKNQMNYENAQKAGKLAQEQRAMANRVEKLRQATKQLEEQLKAAGALDTSLARQLGEAQALLRQALTPELLAQMQKLEASSQQMNGDQSRDAMRDLAQLQKKMREQLEKSAEMLKRAAHEGAMQTLGDEARELAAKERALAEQQKSGEAKPDAARDANQLADRTDRLKSAMEELKQRLAKDKAQAGASKTDEASQHTEKSESAMREAAKAMGSEKAQGESGSGDKKGGQQQKAQSQDGQPQAGPEQNGKQSGAGQKAGDAASEMDRAAQSMQDARSAQVKEWKQELTSELDQSAQEMMQLAREERSLEQKARANQSADERRSAQSAVEQGVDKASERLNGAGKKSALLSSRTQRAMADAKQKVSQATESVAQPNNSAQKQANAMQEAADALTQAAASLARDRERANNASSASGFGEMMKQMQEMAQKQGQINGQSQSLFQLPNGQGSAQGQAMARALARQQRQLSEQLDETSDEAGGQRAAQLAQEARQLAEALDNGRLDGTTLARQQQLFRRMLDAGKSLEKEERDDNGKREAKAATGSEAFTPNGKIDARAALKFRPPTWDEMRNLSADERRAILDYFTRLNSGPATTP